MWTWAPTTCALRRIARSRIAASSIADHGAQGRISAVSAEGFDGEIGARLIALGGRSRRRGLTTEHLERVDAAAGVVVGLLGADDGLAEQVERRADPPAPEASM